MTDQEKIAALYEALRDLTSCAFHANMNAAFAGTPEYIEASELDRACAAMERAKALYETALRTRPCERCGDGK